MADRQKPLKGACPCSQCIDWRGFLKVTTVAGLPAGCSPILETPAPAEAPAAASKPTLATGKTAVPDLTGKKALYILPRNVYALQCHEASATLLKAWGMSITRAAVEKKRDRRLGRRFARADTG